MSEPALVLQGGTLIDGTGRPPVENSVIVIEAGRFKAIARNGQMPLPAGAQVIDVKGKTVLPGFIDGHGHLEDFHGELYLHFGITTCAQIELYQDGPWSRAQKEGTKLGKIRGPRIWMTGRGIGGPLGEHDAFGSRTARGNIAVATPEDARKAVQRKKELGCDIIKRLTRRIDWVFQSPPTAWMRSRPPRPVPTRSSTSGRSATVQFSMRPRGASWRKIGWAGRSIRKSPAPSIRPKTSIG
jgi:hypothetical protein